MGVEVKAFSEDMPEAEFAVRARAFIRELDGAKALLSMRHVRGDDFVTKLFEDVPRFVAASVTAAKELAEAGAADAERAGAVDAGRECIKTARGDARLLIEQLGDPDPHDTSEEGKLANMLRYDFGLRGPRWRPEVNTAVDELLELVHTNMHKHRASFEAIGADDEDFARPRQLKGAIEQSAAAAQKERSESVQATRWANAYRDEAEDLLNMAIAIVNRFAAGSVLQANLVRVQGADPATLG